MNSSPSENEKAYAALIAYDGTDYHGFQRQAEGQPTIQSAVEDALSQLARQPVRLLGSGRTDSGVHAVGQVITFSMTWRHGCEDLRNALNASLPEDVAILKIKEVPPAFHPRFDARRRIYEYYVFNGPTRQPLKRRYSWHVRRPLDDRKMNQAAQCLPGVHDFATFGQPPQGKNSVRQVFVAQWSRAGSNLTFRIEANAFLYRMVRSIVGSLKLIGEGVWAVEEFVTAFRAKDRAACGPVAPPRGLHLVSVEYENLKW